MSTYWSYQPRQLKGLPTSHFTQILSLKNDRTYRQTIYDTNKPYFPHRDVVNTWSYHPKHREIILFHYVQFGKEKLDYCVYTLYKNEPQSFLLRCVDAEKNGAPPPIIQKILDGKMTPQKALQKGGEGFKGNSSAIMRSTPVPLAPCWEGFAYPDISTKLPHGTPYLQIWESTLYPRKYQLAILEILVGHGTSGSFPYSGSPLVETKGLLFKEGVIYQDSILPSNEVGNYSMSPSEELTLNLNVEGIDVKTVDHRIEFKFGKYVMTIPNRCLAHTRAFYSPRE